MPTREPAGRRRYCWRTIRRTRLFLERKPKHGLRMRRLWGAGCALVLLCACIFPHVMLAQSSASGSKASSAKTGAAKTPAKAKSTNSKKHANTAAKKTSAKGTSTAGAKTHSSSHSAAAARANSHTSRSAHSSQLKSASSRKTGKKTTARGQQKIAPERAQEIQEALIREHYLTGEASGTWNQASEDAMRKYQADHGWQSKTVPDSRALISLGLGPNHDHLLNPESAMTTEPEAPHAAVLTPASHSTDPGTPVNANPQVAPEPAPSPERDSPRPQ